MRKRSIIFILLVLLCAIPAWCAGTCVVSDATSSQSSGSRVPDSGTVIVTLVCTADASAHTYPATIVPYFGYYPSSALNIYNLTGYYLYAVGRTPGGTAPTANYTVTITDYRGFALDEAELTANGSATAAQFTIIGPATAPYGGPVVRPGNQTVQISANSVNSAVITLDLIYRAIQ